MIEKLPRINAMRCNFMAVLLTLFIPLLWALEYFLFSKYVFFSTYKEYLVGILVSSIVAVVLLRFVSFNKYSKDKGYMIVSNIYLSVTGVFLFLLADKFLGISGSMVFYFIALLVISFVPVLELSNMIKVSICQYVIMFTYIFKYIDNSELIIQTITINVIMAVVNVWKYYSVLNYMELEVKLNAHVQMSEQDPLTKLTNRRGLERKTSAMFPLCIRHKIPVGVIMMDIDEFKKYNDNFGHPQGDVCIKSISKSLKETARRGSDVVARVGGEEFVVFVQEMEKIDLIFLAKRIRANIESLCIKHADSAEYDNVTVSIGLAYAIPSEDCTFSKLYREADKALYASKSNGRNCISIDGKIISKSKKRMVDSLNYYENYYAREVLVK